LVLQTINEMMTSEKIELTNIKAGDTIELVIDKKSIIVARVFAHGVVPDLSKTFLIDEGVHIPFDDEYANGIIFLGHGPEDSKFYVLLTEGPDFYFYAWDAKNNSKSSFMVFSEDCEMEFYSRSILLLETKR